MLNEEYTSTATSPNTQRPLKKSRQKDYERQRTKSTAMMQYLWDLEGMLHP